MKNACVFLLLLFSITIISAQENLWQKSNIDTKTILPVSTENFEIYELQTEFLKEKLHSVPARFESSSNVIIDLPISSNHIEKFKIFEASNFSPELQSRYPDIRSYVGVGINDPTAMARFSLSPYGFYATIYSGNFSGLNIESIQGTDHLYVVYPQHEVLAEGFLCKTFNLEASEPIMEERNANDGFLRTFRLAMATSSDYSDFHLQLLSIDENAPISEKKAAVLSSVNIAMTKVNSIFERDLGVTMQLISNTDDLFFLDSDDPFTYGDSNANIAENIILCNTVIGIENFDIGHAITGANLGGLAYVGAVCWDDYKAGAVSGLSNPIGDPFYNIILHEMGHQFGAHHSFNNSCGGNHSPNSGIEPGSGTTIMSYAGGCPPNVVSSASQYFNSLSIQEMWRNITRGNSQCGDLTPTNNNAPTASSPLRRLIPKSTPFILEGEVADPDDPSGASLTYSWEQSNSQQAPMPPQNTNTEGPMFRIYEPTSVPYRYMPNVETLRVGATQSRWEVLPDVNRTMDFRFLVRDNNPSGGATASSYTTIQVIANAGPFVVTSQNSSTTWTTQTTETITWDVAQTNTPPLNCTQVDILFSVDGGYTYPYTLAEGVENIGSAVINVPEIETSSGRVMVRASNNIFFDINNRDITIIDALNIDDLTIENLYLYPNPGSSFTLKFKASATSIIYSLYDIRGRLIDHRSYDNQTGIFEESFDYSHLEDGTYFLIIKNGGKMTTKKFIKK